MQTTYAVDIGGKVVELPVLDLEPGLRIAFFNLHGNIELTEYCAKLLAKLIIGADIILTAESKGLQLAHCVARELGHSVYAVARKTKKPYMREALETEVKSVTTGTLQRLYLSQSDAALLKGKKVAIVDDVISGGGSVVGMERLVLLSGGIVYKKAAVLAEGGAGKRDDIVFLAKIPLL